MPLSLRRAPALPDSPGWFVTPELPEFTAAGLAHWHGIHPDGGRQFMASCFYPAFPITAAPQARFLDVFAPDPHGALQVLQEHAAAPPDAAALEALIAWELHAQNSALALPGPFPVLIYYPGGQAHRFSSVAVCEGFAAQGYVVFTLDGPRDAPAVVFPDGAVVTPPAPDDESYIWPRIDDIRLLLDHLPEINASGPLQGRLDLDHIGIFGASRGGYLSNIMAVEDARIKAAVNMDGFLWGLWTEGTGLDQYPEELQAKVRALKTPILRLSREGKSRAEEEIKFVMEAKDFSGNYRGIALPGFSHSDFGGTGWLCGPLDRCLEKLDPVFDEAKHRTLFKVLSEFFREVM